MRSLGPAAGASIHPRIGGAKCNLSRRSITFDAGIGQVFQGPTWSSRYRCQCLKIVQSQGEMLKTQQGWDSGPAACAANKGRTHDCTPTSLSDRCTVRKIRIGGVTGERRHPEQAREQYCIAHSSTRNSWSTGTCMAVTRLFVSEAMPMIASRCICWASVMPFCFAAAVCE